MSDEVTPETAAQAFAGVELPPTDVIRQAAQWVAGEMRAAEERGFQRAVAALRAFLDSVTEDQSPSPVIPRASELRIGRTFVLPGIDGTWQIEGWSTSSSSAFHRSMSLSLRRIDRPEG